MANKLSLILEAVDRITKPLTGIVARVRRLNAELKLGQLMASGKQVGTALGNVGSAAEQMARRAITSIGLIGGGLFALVKRSADAADATNDMAARVGINVGSLQRLGWAAQMAGSNQEEMGQGIANLNKRIVAAASGNKAMAENFRRLGINVKDATGKLKPTEQVMAEIADKFQDMPDGAKKSAIAMALLGNQVGLKLVPTLNGGAEGLKAAGDEFERLHGTLTQDTADAAGKFNDGLDRMFSALGGVQQAIAGKLLPILTPMIEQFTAWIVANREWIATEIGTFIGQLPGHIASTRDSLKGLWSTLQPVVGMFRALVEWIGPANTAFIALGTYIGGKFVLSVLQLGFALVKFGGALGITSAGLVKVAGAMMAGLVSPIGLAIAAVALIAGAVYLIYRNWDVVGPYFKRLWDGIVSIFGGFIDFVAGVFTGDFGRAFDGLKAMFAGYIAFYAAVWDGVKAAFTAFSGWVKDSFGVDLMAGFAAVWDFISPIVDKIAGAIGFLIDGFGKVKGMASGAIDSVGSFFSDAWDSMSGGGSAAGSLALAGGPKVDVGGTMRIVVDDNRVRIAEVRPSDPRRDWETDTGKVMP